MDELKSCPSCDSDTQLSTFFVGVSCVAIECSACNSYFVYSFVEAPSPLKDIKDFICSM